MRLRPDIDKFSFGQLTSNSDGKTSGSGTAGLYIVAIGGVCFMLGCVDKMFFGNNIDIVTQSIVLIGIGAALLGYRKSKDKGVTVEEVNNEEPLNTESGDQMLNS
jgi:hypothetical protein